MMREGWLMMREMLKKILGNNRTLATHYVVQKLLCCSKVTAEIVGVTLCFDPPLPDHLHCEVTVS